MIDIKLVREDREKLKKAVTDKQLDPSWVDKAYELDEKKRELTAKLDEVRQRKNQIAKENSEEAREAGREVKDLLKKLEPELKLTEEELKAALSKLPNPALADVKVGKNDTENDVVRNWGEIPQFDFPIKPHWEIAENLKIIDIDRASKVSGSRFFYLVGDGFRLQRSIEQFALEILYDEGFVPVMPPVLIKKESMAGMGYLENGGEEDMYVLNKDGLVLVGTSEQSIGPMHKDEILNVEKPIRYCGYSSCFRREAGSYGKDTKGAFRVHQFQKIEMFSFVKEEESDREHEFLLSIEEKFLQKLGIPYEVSKMCTGDLGMPAARKYDLNGWFPHEGKFRELTSTSTCTDFQARRLNIKYKDGGATKYVHMLNGTAFSQRPILAILENYQQKDGSVKVPEVLQKWMGKDIIKPRNA